MTVGQVIDRGQWGARAPRSTSSRIDPTGGVVGHYGGGSPLWPYTPERAFTLVRGWQAFHMDGRGWADIAYNLIVDLHGRIFIGRGHRVRSAANGTDEANGSRYAICLLAGGNDPLTDEAKAGFMAARRLLRNADARTGLAVVGHRDVRSTDCPGPTVQAWIVAGCPLPEPRSSTEGDLLMPVALNDDDARRCLIRQWFGEYLGRGFRSASEQNLHLLVFQTKGADLCLAGIIDSEEAAAYRRRTTDTR
jgi:hypothetical protein